VILGFVCCPRKRVGGLFGLAATQQGQHRREQAVTAQPGQSAHRRRTNLQDPHHELDRAPHRINHGLRPAISFSPSGRSSPVGETCR